MKKFVILLDEFLEPMPDDWPVSLESDDLEVLRRARCFDGNPNPIGPRASFPLRKLETKTMTHCLRPFENHPGAIYERL